MDELWKIILKYVDVDLDDAIVYDSNHDYVDLLDDLGYDSIKLISLIVDIEAFYNIEIDDNYLLIEHLRKYDSISNIIKLGGKYHEDKRV